MLICYYFNQKALSLYFATLGLTLLGKHDAIPGKRILDEYGGQLNSVGMQSNRTHSVK